MKIKNTIQIIKSNIILIVGILGAIASIVGFMVALSEISSIGKILNSSIAGLFAAFLGMAVSYIILYFIKSRKKGKIFVSYSLNDKKIVDKLIKILIVEKYDISTDKEEILVGEELNDGIVRAIKDSDFVMMIISKSSLNSNWFFREIRLASEIKKIIIPVRIEQIDLPINLEGVMIADLYEDFEIGARQLMKSLNKIAAKKKYPSKKNEIQKRIGVEFLESQKRKMMEIVTYLEKRYNLPSEKIGEYHKLIHDSSSISGLYYNVGLVSGSTASASGVPQNEIDEYFKSDVNPDLQKCPYCNEALTENDIDFCSKCGKRFIDFPPTT